MINIASPCSSFSGKTVKSPLLEALKLVKQLSGITQAELTLKQQGGSVNSWRLSQTWDSSVVFSPEQHNRTDYYFKYSKF